MKEAIVATPEEADRLPHGAALVLDPLEGFLDDLGLGAGRLSARPIGGGHSNLTFLLRRGEDEFVLRRPPRGDLAASANDVLRESRILEALRSTPVPVPEVLGRCEDPAVIGADFFLMTRVDGAPINDGLPVEFDDGDAPTRIVDSLIRALAGIHAADPQETGLIDFGRPSGYLGRQLRRFSSLLDENSTRPLPDLEEVGEWLRECVPVESETTFVHGDYRLGNLMFRAPTELTAVLDWEMATVGDPLADLGYLTATWASAGDEWNPMNDLSRATAVPGFPGREQLSERYSKATGRSTDNLLWYQILALWKSAIFLEGSYRRHQEGASSDPFFARLDDGVPALARIAGRWISLLSV